MNENERPGGSPGGATGLPRPHSNEQLHTDKQSHADKDAMSRTASDISSKVADEASALGHKAQHAAEDQADMAKESAASHMHAFADALRTASDELGKKQSGPAAEMVSSAAAGLEGFSRSLHGKSTGEMVDKVRQFGRENPMGFLAGSVLAGFALARFATAATPPSTPARHAGDTSATAAGRQTPPSSTSTPSARPGSTAYQGGYTR